MRKYKNLIIRDPKEFDRIIFYVPEGEKVIEDDKKYENEGLKLELTTMTYTEKWGVFWETGGWNEDSAD